VVRSSWALFPTGSAPGTVGVSSRRCRDPTTKGVRADRVGIKLSRQRPKGWSRVEAPPTKVGRLLARETSTGGRSSRSDGVSASFDAVLGRSQGLPELARWRHPCLERGPCSSARLRSCLAGRSDGGARATPESETGDARKRTHAALIAPETGSGGPAVVLAGCVGCRSRRAALGPGREAMGLALWLVRSGVRAQKVKRRRKPGRGGESYEHASSDTGGGLLVIPRAPRESAVRDRGREHSAMEGVLVRRKPPSLTRRRERRAW